MENKIFRKKTMEKISSPEQLSDYLRVTNPGIWIVLSAVILILVGLVAWAAAGTIETTASANASVSNGKASIVITGSTTEDIKTGMTVHLVDKDYVISEVAEDEYGRAIAYTEVTLPDGSYDAEVVVEEIHPIKFLFESR
ncbi:MAG: hypothetical protein IJV15_12035 [Lachnospiraceae bacterium]|nr:hypothetical protein [Lachnospiraceae bacterium]